ncbi:MAG: hypothetical protein IJ390_14060, partial [Lachnospiraceae bacterium]|nr:hypothetical protein [Lachnospiraceae bacterium]
IKKEPSRTLRFSRNSAYQKGTFSNASLFEKQRLSKRNLLERFAFREVAPNQQNYVLLIRLHYSMVDKKRK